MKTQFLLALFQIISYYSICQTDSGSVAILESLVRLQHPKGTFFYTDKVDSSEILLIKESFKARKFIWEARPNKNDTILLTKKEKRFLDSCINALYSFHWADNLFQDSKRIPRDSMWPRIQKQNQESYERRKRDTANVKAVDFVQDLVENANTFQFSPLFYLRNKSVFLVYILRLCGDLCGVDELSFYRLEGGKYRRWVVVRSGAF